LKFVFSSFNFDGGPFVGLGLIGIFLTEMLATTILPIPSPLIVGSLAVFTNSYLLAILFAVLGACCGASINFFVGRIFRTVIFRRKLNKWKSYNKFNNFWKVKGIPLLLVNGVVPISFFDFFTLISGASTLEYLPFLGSVLISKLIMYLLIIGILAL